MHSFVEGCGQQLGGLGCVHLKLQDDILLWTCFMSGRMYLGMVRLGLSLGLLRGTALGMVGGSARIFCV